MNIITHLNNKIDRNEICELGTTVEIEGTKFFVYKTINEDIVAKTENQKFTSYGICGWDFGEPMVISWSDFELNQ